MALLTLFGGSFSPLSLSPALWLKADVGTFQTDGGAAAAADADPVGQWLDQSGNGRHLAQATAGLRPTLKLNTQNGRPVVRFDGVDDYIGLASAFAQQHWFAVAKYSAATFAAFAGLISDPTAGSIVLTGENGTANWFTGDGAFTGGTYVKDGVSVAATGTCPGPMNAFACMDMAESGVRTQGLQVGNDRGTAGRYWAGDVGEVIAFPATLSAANAALVRAYLKARWGTP